MGAQRKHLSFKAANVLRMRDKLSEYSDAFKDEIVSARAPAGGAARG